MVAQAHEEGFGNCTNIGECEAVCPKGIQLENIARMNRDYLAGHAWANAEGADLWNALSRVSGREVSKTVTSFLDQGGVPFVSAYVTDAATLQIQQTQFYNIGAAPETTGHWLTPMTFKYSDGKTVHSRTVMLGDDTQTLTLPDVRRIEWVLPNAEERGYYHWNVVRDMRWTLVDRSREILSPRERVGLVNNLSAGLDAGIVPSQEALEMFGRMASDPRPEVLGAVLDAFDRIRVALITPDLEEAFSFYLRRQLGPALDRIGFAPAPGETQATTLLRPRLMQWVGRRGHDAKLMERARTLGDAYLRDPAAVDPSLIEAVLRLAAAGGDKARFAEYQRRFEQAKTPGERARFLNALGSFRDSTLIERALDYTLTPAVRPSEMSSVWSTVRSETVNEERAFQWMTRNYDGLTKRMPPYALAYLIRFADGCSSERLDWAKAFFTRERRAEGFEVELAKTQDHVTDCENLRRVQGRTIRNYLNTLTAPK